MLTTVVVKLRDNVKKGEGITVHDKDKNLVTLVKGSDIESAECTEADAKSYVANYGHLLETVTQEDLNKQVSAITDFLKKKFPKEFGKADVEPEKEEKKDTPEQPVIPDPEQPDQGDEGEKTKEEQKKK